MSKNEYWYVDNTPKPSLRVWILSQMTMGAAYAAVVLFGVIAFILILRAISFLLPEDPFAALEFGSQALNALV
ncbi:MAG: RC-LH1 core complex protein PufX [Pseudomonadota bacterium]